MKKIEIDGKKYRLDVEKAKELKILQELTQYRVGMLVKNGYEVYLVANVDHFKIALINVESGNRWTNPVIVGDWELITTSEWDKITGNDPSSFTIINP